MFRSIYNSKEKIWRGLDQPPVFNSKASLGRVILYSLKINSNKIAQVS